MLGLTENGIRFLVNPDHSDFEDFRDLDTKVITIIASHNGALKVSDLVTYVRSSKSGLSFSFIEPKYVLRTVEKLIKLDLVKYNVRPELSIEVKDNNVKKTRRSGKSS